MSALAKVAVARPLLRTFTYLMPQEWEARVLPGMRVRVPFGRSTALGFYLGLAEPPASDVKLKAVAQLLDDAPALTPQVLELCLFAARHYRYPIGETLKAALPPGFGKPLEVSPRAPSQEWVRITKSATIDAVGRAPAQRAVLAYLIAVGGRALVSELAIAVDGSAAQVRKLVAKGLALRESAPSGHQPDARPAQLTLGQIAALEVLNPACERGGFAPFLLRGITGSGKTEVYLRLVEGTLARGKCALVLVPEIALTPQLVGRFQARFGDRVAVLHSGLKDSERASEWWRLKRGEATIAVGVRSAIWAPTGPLGLVVVDEEHDASFKQEEKLRYQARDLAVVRAQREECPVVLGSATPSLESLHNAQAGKYRLVAMDARVENRPLPSIEMVDLRAIRPRSVGAPAEPPVLSIRTREALAATLERGQQAIIFLNRRGHATFVTCEVCGLTLACDDCAVALTSHLRSGRLECHYCGTHLEIPPTCPECRGPLLQLGIGTERIESEVADVFPKARIERLDRDAVANARDITQVLARFARREADILIGTQMVAKGHDFPGVTLVCVALADSALAIPDFRAAERTLQLLTQVAGRAGRGADAGHVIVQTYNPEAPPIAAMAGGDLALFVEREMQRRKVMNWPPYSRLAAIRMEGENAEGVRILARRLAAVVTHALPPRSSAVRILGPCPAPLSKLRGQWRWQLVLKAPTYAALEPLLLAAEGWLEMNPPRAKVTIDVDPVAML